MTRVARALTFLPFATLVGVALGLLMALVAAVLSVTPLRITVHPLAPFALSMLPALLGAWVDWARTWRPTPRARSASFVGFALSVLAAATAAKISSDGGSPTAGLWLAGGLPLGAAAMLFMGSRALLFLARRGVSVFGFELVCGTVRVEESSRVVIDTSEGLVEVDRDASADLGAHRTFDLSIGSTIALLGRTRDLAATEGPFRSERRARAHDVLGVAGSPRDLRIAVRRRTRAWLGYLLVLALGSTAFATAVAYPGAPSCAVAKTGDR